ncbi:MAG TPA: hypothetical protein V6C76_12375 [Drouetiella sp.]
MSQTNKSRTYLSSAVVALCLLFAVDACYSLAKPSNHKESKFKLEQSDVLNVLKAYRDEPKTPDVALLGSSLIEVPSIEAAALAANKPVDRLTHHRCDCLEQELTKQTGVKSSVVSLAIGGEMVSDAYLLTKRLLIGQRAPHAIIYGIGPRDFQDNLMPGVESSDTFKVLSSIDDLPDLWQSRQLSIENKMTLTLENLSSFCGDRTQIVAAANSTANQFAAPFLAKETKPAEARPANNILKFIGGMIAPGEAVWHPDDEYMLTNYLSRYNPVSRKQINTQLGYFDRLLKLCKEQKTPIMIVNMPLGETNRKVMAPGFYEQYMLDTQKICAANNVPYVDLNSSPLNEKPNFLDTVHLNPNGSAKMFALMSKNIDPTIAVALRDADKAVASAPSRSY